MNCRRQRSWQHRYGPGWRRGTRHGAKAGQVRELDQPAVPSRRRAPTPHRPGDRQDFRMTAKEGRCWLPPATGTARCAPPSGDVGRSPRARWKKGPAYAGPRPVSPADRRGAQRMPQGRPVAQDRQMLQGPGTAVSARRRQARVPPPGAPAWSCQSDAGQEWRRPEIPAGIAAIRQGFVVVSSLQLFHVVE